MFPRFGMLPGDPPVWCSAREMTEPDACCCRQPWVKKILRLMQANLTKGGPKLIALLLLGGASQQAHRTRQGGPSDVVPQCRPHQEFLTMQHSTEELSCPVFWNQKEDP